MNEVKGLQDSRSLTNDGTRLIAMRSPGFDNVDEAFGVPPSGPYRIAGSGVIINT
jgi:hypothetical protein